MVLNLISDLHLVFPKDVVEFSSEQMYVSWAYFQMQRTVN